MNIKIIKFLLSVTLLMGAVWNFYTLDAADVHQYSREEIIHCDTPVEETSSDRHIGQALPGTSILFNASRRNHDFLRNFRLRSNSQLIPCDWHCTIKAAPRYHTELQHITFAFQTFLQNSLPPRAGPRTI